MAGYGKSKCRQTCASKYDKLITFLRPPDELDANYEIDTRDWAAWTEIGPGYVSIVTGGGREIEVANQIHGHVDAIIECQWGSVSRTVDFGCAIRRQGFGDPTYWQVIAAINVNENNVTMKFICRNTKPNGSN